MSRRNITPLSCDNARDFLGFAQKASRFRVRLHGVFAFDFAAGVAV
jgi:hypothetical protein